MSLDSKRTARTPLPIARYVLLALLLISAGTASAQWLPNPYSSGPIYFTGGSVGIGTTNTSLQNGDVGIVISSAGPSLRLTSTDLTLPRPGDPPSCGDYELGSTPGGFAIFDGCALVPRLAISPDGSVTLGALKADSVNAHYLMLETEASDLLRVNDARSWAAGNGGSITFGGHITSQTESQDFARIAGIKENATDLDHSSALLFFTRPNTTDLTERMRIASDGLVTIGLAGGTTTKLNVNGIVQSASGGFKFPDGTTQTTAAASSRWSLGTAGAIYYSSGNVGIGTTTPASPLTVAGIVQSTSGGFKFPDGTTQTTAASSGTSSQWTSGTNSIFYSGGNVGIGSATNPPPYRLTVTGGHIAVDNGSQLISRNGAGSGYYRLIGADTSDHVLLGDNTGTFANEIRFHSMTNGTPSAVIATNGNVGIGTALNVTPSARLEVSQASADTTLRQEVARVTRSGGSSTAATPLRSALLSFYDGANGTLTAAVGGYRGNANNDYNGGLQFFVNNTGAASASAVSQLTEALRIDNSGNLLVGQPTTSTPKTVEVNGDLHASGTISGGTVLATYQDLAEWVPASGNLPAGTVVVLNRARRNEVAPSTSAYDTAVAGVVSEKPGLLLGKGNSGEAKIATTGRVIVRVDATKHPIAIGDLLVTSEKPGVAMFSEPVDLGGVKIHRPGTIIGKALEPLQDGEGEILVLLSLQ